jgi:hypothetical protein
VMKIIIVTIHFSNNEGGNARRRSTTPLAS